MTTKKNSQVDAHIDCADAKTIGAYVRATRTEEGVTLNALSDRCEMPRSTVYRIESGTVTPSLSTLERLAHGLGMELEIRFVHR